ncbi:MAG: GlgC family sugar phosphate nucleotidyltransferase, partial [Planctomycetota bacterium]
LGRRVRVHSFASVEESVVFDGCELERGCHVKRAILDKYVVIKAGERVGFDAEEDRAKGYHVTESGITVVPKRPVVRPCASVNL